MDNRTHGHTHEHENCYHGHTHEHENCCHGHTHEHDGCGCNHNRKIENAEIKAKISKLAASLLAFIPAVLLHRGILTFEVPPYAFVGLFVLAYFLCAFEIFKKAINGVASGHFLDENTLMSVASLAAISLGEIEEGFAVLFLYNLGEFLQDLSVSRSRGNISKLMDGRPDVAAVKRDGKITVIPADEVKVGEVFLVKPGEKIPLDGKILAGECFVDERALTGEPVPKKKVVGNDVFAGTVAMDGLLEIEATTEFAASTVAKILELVEHSAAKKSKTEKFITRFAKVYTPIVFSLAVAVAFIPPFLGFGEISHWIYKGLTFLIISCPCALVISVPLAFFSGIGNAAKNGILVRGADIFDTLASLKTLVFDKTGTLTKGNFSVIQVISANETPENKLLETAAFAEQYSNHPVAKAICNKVGKVTGEMMKTHWNLHTEEEREIEFSEFSGEGIAAKWGNTEIIVGNQKLVGKSRGFQSFTGPQTCVYVAVNEIFLGTIVIADEIKENAAADLQNLRKQGIEKLFILSGDNSAITAHVATQLALDGFSAELLPADKLSELEKIMDREKLPCAFIGDGINDAPVLMRADLGIAMGRGGSDAAVEAADLVIMNDEIDEIALAIKIAVKTRRRATENIVGALSVKIAVMAFALFATCPIPLAIFADVGVALLTVFNSLRRK